MVGYGPEDSHFVVELTYNYNISSYKLGNDFQVNVPGTIVSFHKEKGRETRLFDH